MYEKFCKELAFHGKTSLHISKHSLSEPIDLDLRFNQAVYCSVKLADVIRDIERLIETSKNSMGLPRGAHVEYSL